MNPTDNSSHPALTRRSVLTGAVALGLGAALVAMPATAAPKPEQPEADSGHDYDMPKPNPKTEREFRMGGIGFMVLNLKTSEIAVDRAANPGVREFAHFELREQLGATMVLKEMKTPIPQLDPASKANLVKLQAMGAGPEFDKAYLQQQLATHEFLRDAATAYIKNSAGKMSGPEMHGRHLATLMLGQIKDHVVLIKNMQMKMGA